MKFMLQRIGLALPLAGIVLVAGCGGQAEPTTGTPGQVTPAMPPGATLPQSSGQPGMTPPAMPPGAVPGQPGMAPAMPPGQPGMAPPVSPGPR